LGFLDITGLGNRKILEDEAEAVSLPTEPFRGVRLGPADLVAPRGTFPTKQFVSAAIRVDGHKAAVPSECLQGSEDPAGAESKEGDVLGGCLRGLQGEGGQDVVETVCGSGRSPEVADQDPVLDQPDAVSIPDKPDC
jgi:hypothetical protein